MGNYSKIYWLTRLDYLQGFLTAFIVISIIVIIFYCVCWCMEFTDSYGDTTKEQEKYKKNYGKYRNISIWVAILCSLLLAFIPSKEDMILIYAGGKTMNYIQSDTSLSKIPYQTTTIISDYLDKQIKELKK